MHLIKKIAIAIIFLLFLGSIGFLVYGLFPHAPAASCGDGIQNQGEAGIDCGGPCVQICANPEELILFQTKVIPTKEGFVDAFAELRNGNIAFGIPALRYTFEFYDAANALITSRAGVTYILPNDSKYIVESAIPVAREARSVKFTFHEPQFKAVKDYVKPRLVALNTASDDELGFTRVRGIIANQTNNSYESVMLTVLLRDDVDRVIAVNKQEITTLVSNEQRFFDLRWPYKKPFSRSIQTRVETNVFDDANVIRYAP